MEVQRTKIDENWYLFRTDYINGEGNSQTCSLKLNLSSKNKNLHQGKTEVPDTCANKLPMWRAIQKLINEALIFSTGDDK